MSIKAVSELLDKTTSRVKMQKTAEFVEPALCNA